MTLKTLPTSFLLLLMMAVVVMMLSSMFWRLAEMVVMVMSVLMVMIMLVLNGLLPLPVLPGRHRERAISVFLTCYNLRLHHSVSMPQLQVEFR